MVDAEKSTGRPSKRSILDKLPTLIRLANGSSLHIHVTCQFFLIKILAHELSVSVRLFKIKPCKGKGFAFRYRTLLSCPREQSNQCCSLKVYGRDGLFNAVGPAHVIAHSMSLYREFYF